MLQASAIIATSIGLGALAGTVGGPSESGVIDSIESEINDEFKNRLKNTEDDLNRITGVIVKIIYFVQLTSEVTRHQQGFKRKMYWKY